MNTKNKPVLWVLLLCLFTTSIHQFATAQSFQFSGEELFAGIYFSNGPVLDAVPVLKQYGYSNYVSDENVLEAASRFQSDITNAVKMAHPNLFNNLKTEIASGDHGRISQCLESNSAKINQVMLNFMYQSTGVQPSSNEVEKKEQLKNFLNSYGPNIDPNGSDPQGLVGIVWVAVWLWEYVWQYDEFILPHEMSSGDEGLQKEQLVAELANL